MNVIKFNPLIRITAAFTACLMLTVLSLRTIHEVVEHSHLADFSHSPGHSTDHSSERDCAICAWAVFPFIPSEEIDFQFSEADVFEQIQSFYFVPDTQSGCVLAGSRGPPSAA